MAKTKTSTPKTAKKKRTSTQKPKARTSAEARIDQTVAPWAARISLTPQAGGGSVVDKMALPSSVALEGFLATLAAAPAEASAAAAAVEAVGQQTIYSAAFDMFLARSIQHGAPICCYRQVLGGEINVYQLMADGTYANPRPWPAGTPIPYPPCG